MYEYEQYFSVDGLMDKVSQLTGDACCELIEKVLTLYVLLIQGDVATATKVFIISALGYFICPIDAVPDVLPIVGYSDDLAIVAALLSQLDDLVNANVKKEVKRLMPEFCC